METASRISHSLTRSKLTEIALTLAGPGQVAQHPQRVVQPVPGHEQVVVMKRRHHVARDALVRQRGADAGQEAHGVQGRMHRQGEQARFELVGQPQRLRLPQRHDGRQALGLMEGAHRGESVAGGSWPSGKQQKTKTSEWTGGGVCLRWAVKWCSARVVAD